MECLFFEKCKSYSSSKLFFPSICEEIQTLFFADGSEVVRLGSWIQHEKLYHPPKFRRDPEQSENQKRSYLIFHLQTKTNST